LFFIFLVCSLFVFIFLVCYSFFLYAITEYHGNDLDHEDSRILFSMFISTVMAIATETSRACRFPSHLLARGNEVSNAPILRRGHSVETITATVSATAMCHRLKAIAHVPPDSDAEPKGHLTREDTIRTRRTLWCESCFTRENTRQKRERTAFAIQVPRPAQPLIRLHQARAEANIDGTRQNDAAVDRYDETKDARIVFLVC
jgi:hypothetical protein